MKPLDYVLEKQLEDISKQAGQHALDDGTFARLTPRGRLDDDSRLVHDGVGHDCRRTPRTGCRYLRTAGVAVHSQPKKLGSGARWAVNWSVLTARNVGGQAMPMASSKAEGSAVARTDRQADGVTWVQKRPF